MKNKREILKHVIETKALCKTENCKECPYWKNSRCRELKVVGAMAILRMFKEKPMLRVGTKIKFENGKCATINTNEQHYFLTFENYENEEYSLEYLIGKNWKIVE